ncbi:MAG: bifunctional diaminohydroxyphosphoribosylaminopyrimidine deaminase/5-amino-6-(5-phosphoribosylamino)uracil reductase RibD [Caldisericia bacterium]|nr:bifunctional diaminohydroxyphosphoribosylaminopyrimidine deaminase/5-amino-6-(5-phosphoribosylamino)uracil reductase RibD [Caldisericia bacterium]
MDHEKWMKIALNESLRGIGFVQPNPLVGAVLVQNDQIVATGFHDRFGGKHAEIHAIEAAQKKGISLHTCTLYVTLEPCNHTGKNPPCTERILREKIPQVVIGIQDPNPLVQGKGIQTLRSHGVAVIEQIWQDQIKEANRMYIKWMTKKTPWVSLKMALSLDGFISSPNNPSKWISSEESREIVHQMRLEHAGIMVGSSTILQDNPRLTVRKKDSVVASPTRIILDRHNQIQKPTYTIFTLPGKTILFSPKAMFSCDNTEHIHPSDYSPKTILNTLYEKGIQSVLIEGGSKVAQEFYPFLDRLYMFLSPSILSQGRKPFDFTRPIQLQTRKVHTLQTDILWELESCSQES